MSTRANTAGRTPAGATSQGHSEAIQQYTEQRRVFSVHARVFAASMIFIVLVNAFTNAAAGLTREWGAWWSVWALLGWGAGLTVHGLVLKMARPESLASALSDR